MATAKPKEESNQLRDVIPEIIIDPVTKKTYNRGRFLGKGGFARCYELTDMTTKQLYAGKIVSKTLLVKQHQKDKMAQEITIHRDLKHQNVVKFISFFEDVNNVYIILEICKRRSLMEMHKRRKALTEPETRYFLKQIVTGCKYLHDTGVIHRDLKLGNLFLNDEMELKIGDFGLATKLAFEGERKKTLCGTPNYIAPEVLGKKGHSFEVDVWSLGCIMFTLLVGRPPFETSNLKDTYTRIKKNEFAVPSRISRGAQSLIKKLLQAEPSKRPTMDDIINDEFMIDGYCPSRLPTACLTTAPRFDQRAEFSMLAAPRQPLLEVKQSDNNEMKKVPVLAEKLKIREEEEPEDANRGLDQPVDYYLGDLFNQLNKVMASKPTERINAQEDEAEDPMVGPMLWVSKWVDYSDKYGLGYQLCDNSVGVLFNDSTKLLLLQDNVTIHYVERDGKEHYHSLTNFPTDLTKKVTLIKYFRNYMNDHLLKAGASMVPRDGDDLARLPYMRSWFRTRSAIVLHLTNGTLQMNFFEDHTKLILCPLMNAVTYINANREFRTFRLSAIERFGCGKELYGRLRYAKTMVERLIASRVATAKTKSVTAATPMA